MPNRRPVVIERMMSNFEADLGEAFTLEPIDHTPSRRMVRCFYHDFFLAEDELTLPRIFTAMHGSTWEGVPGFEFVVPDGVEKETDGQCSFIFR